MDEEGEDDSLSAGKDEDSLNKDSSSETQKIDAQDRNSVVVQTIVANSQSDPLLGLSASMSSSSPAPPELPPRPSSSNSMGPPVSRLNKSPCDELDLLFPRMRRDSTRGIVGFDFGAGTWEVLSEEQKISKSTKK